MKESGSVNLVAKLGAWVILIVHVLDWLAMTFMGCHSAQLQAFMS